MKRFLFLLAIVAFLNACTSKDETHQIKSIIPQPVSITNSKGSFTIDENTRILSNSEEQSIRNIITQINNRIEKVKGTSLRTSTSNEALDNSVFFNLDPSFNEDPEAYQLTVSKTMIEIKSSAPAGLFYGLQSLWQLAPPRIYSNDVQQDFELKIPCTEIIDYPRFKWRGYMLDVSRHFLPKEYILQLMDYLAMHKINRFHWHLVDDQGWRIEIKQFPKLTEIGAWRVNREHLHWNARPKQEKGEVADYGGFYSQDDVLEIVKYASDRNITIVPEIEMPAHVTSALAAYPHLACTDGPFTVPPGGVWPITDIYCAGKESTFDFLEKVLDEVITLFPSEYIHIGGDEATKTEWKKCPDCQNRMKKEGLENEHELQSYFIQRIEKYLNSKGRQIIGWDEILEGGLAPNAAVMSWRGMQGGTQAAKAKHPVVMSPTSHCYFDYYQGKPELEPLAIGGNLPLEKVYSFDPVPEELSQEEAGYIMGGQANLWTEYVPNPEHAMYMTFPRLAALAEVVWTPKENKDYQRFTQALLTQLERYDFAGIHYAKSVFNVDVHSSFDMESKSYQVELKTGGPNAEIRYTTDGSEPDENSEKYVSPLDIKESCTIKSSSFYKGKKLSKTAAQQLIIHKATGILPKINVEPAEKYASDGPISLTNSMRGSKNIGDGFWMGYHGDDIEIRLDLEKEADIHEISCGFIQHTGAWVFFPDYIQVFKSSDGKNYTEAGEVINTVSAKEPEIIIKDFSLKENFKSRYIKIFVKSINTCPSWHNGAGDKAWVFMDEIIIK